MHQAAVYPKAMNRDAGAQRTETEVSALGTDDPRDGMAMPNENVVLGAGATIDPSTAFNAWPASKIRIGDNTKIYPGADLCGPITIGDRCFFNRDAYIRANTTIGDEVRVGPFARFITDTHEIGPSERRAGANITEPIHVGNGSWIGAGATILGGVTIGNGVIVAAGSMVVRDVPDNVLVAGVPARIVKYLDENRVPQPPVQQLVRKLAAKWSRSKR